MPPFGASAAPATKTARGTLACVRRATPPVDRTLFPGLCTQACPPTAPQEVHLMKRHRFTRFCAVFFATAIAIAAFGCTERGQTTSPKLQTKPRVGYLVDYDVPCWYYASLDCYDGTTAGGILDGSQY